MRKRFFLLFFFLLISSVSLAQVDWEGQETEPVSSHPTAVNQTPQFQRQLVQQLFELRQTNQRIQSELLGLRSGMNALKQQLIPIQTINEPGIKGVWHRLINPEGDYAFKILMGIILIIVLLILSIFLPRRKVIIREVATSPSVDYPASVDTKEEYDFMSSEEALPAKLDLARAYIDMEDTENAKKALEEVVAKGDLDQQREARDLLQSIQ